MSDGQQAHADSERLSDQAWNYHRERQLEALGVDPDELDAGDQG